MKFFRDLLIAVSGIVASLNIQATVVSLVDVADGGFGGSAGSGYTLSTIPNDVYLRVFGSTGGCCFTRAAVEFSMAGLNTGDIVNLATFQIKSGGTAVAGGQMQFWGYSGDGAISNSDATETSMLLDTQPTQAGSPLYSVDVTAFLQGLLVANATHAGILITIAEEGPNTFLGNDLESRYNTTAGHFLPVINADISAGAVPEPGSLALLGLGLLGATLARRRPRRN